MVAGVAVAGVIRRQAKARLKDQATSNN
jgi:hypothetical protein